MGVSIISVIKDIFKPAVELVDDLHTSDEERLAHKARTLDTYVKAIEKGLEYESQQLQARARIVEAEAKSEHKLTATWRPIVMLGFAASVMAHWFGLTPDDLTPEAVELMFGLVKIGLGGYVIGRSAEKTAKEVTKALKKRDEV